MKYFVITCFFVIRLSLSFGQSLESSIKTLSEDLARKITKKHLTRISLADFVNEEGKKDAAVDYIQHQVEMDLINALDIEVIDRKNLDPILRENQFLSAGLIAESTEKKAVSFTKVEGWVFGVVTNIGDKFKLALTVTDGTTTRRFAVAESDFLDASGLKKILTPKACRYCNGTGTVKTAVTCIACDGTGGKKCNVCGGNGRDFISAGLGGNAPCNICRGTGKINCQVCKGKGQATSFSTCKKCNGTGKET